MTWWSSLSSAVGLLFLFSLNSLMPKDADANATIISEKNESIYCLLDRCPIDTAKPHYGCNNNGNWAAECGKEPKLINITNKIRKFLVNRHNTFRDIVAGGGANKLPIAGRMCKLSWDADLADVAQMLVKRCDLKPTNRCISTMKFEAPGLNAAYNKFKKKQDPYRIVRSQLNAWYDQYKHMRAVNLLIAGSLFYEVDHFRRMMMGPSTRLGCAMALTEKNGWYYQWLTCLYSCSPKKDHLIYEFSTLPGAFCVNGLNEQFQNLCSDQEYVDSCMQSTWLQTDRNNMEVRKRTYIIPGAYPLGYPALGYPYHVPLVG